MVIESEKSPLVFLSYSHDSEDHKAWVRNLAERLVGDGIDVILDEWDVGPGDDLVAFMSASVHDSDKVLMICTQPYVTKADDGVGGVGYEQLIVTSQLIKDLGTNKFIPIVRQPNQADPITPRALGARFYVNLSSDDRKDMDAEYDKLIRVVHRAPANPKPPIGRSPFALSPDGEAAAPVKAIDPPRRGAVLPPREFYVRGVGVAKSGDASAWNRLMRSARNQVATHLAAIREGFAVPQSAADNDRARIALEFSSVFEPLYALMVAGAMSGRDEFNIHGGAIEELTNRPDWINAGLMSVVRLPQIAGFVGQALVGSGLIFSRQLAPLQQFVNARITYNGAAARPLWEQGRLIGFPESLSSGRAAWRFLVDLYQHWDWLELPFGDEEDYIASLVAYYMTLSVHAFSNRSDQFARTIADNPSGKLIDTYIPAYYIGEDDEIGAQAYRLLSADLNGVRGLWFNDEQKRQHLMHHWDAWIEHTRSGYAQAIQVWDVGNAHHKRLGQDVLN